MGAQAADADAPGFDREAYGDESPPHKVRVEGFHLGRYPVTVMEFQRFVDDGGYGDEALWSAGGFGELGEAPDDWDGQIAHPTRPVVDVSWYEASAYCQWLTRRRRNSGAAGTSEMARLPTETEWEWAARGAVVRQYPWGDETPDAERCNFAQNAGAPTPVGVYPVGATPAGTSDMAGNVWEWCLDAWQENYGWISEFGTATNPVADQGERRCLRGGSWYNGSRQVRAAVRNGGRPIDRDDRVGFRVLLS